MDGKGGLVVLFPTSPCLEMSVRSGQIVRRERSRLDKFCNWLGNERVAKNKYYSPYV